MRPPTCQIMQSLQAGRLVCQCFVQQRFDVGLVRQTFGAGERFSIYWIVLVTIAHGVRGQYRRQEGLVDYERHNSIADGASAVMPAPEI